MVIQYWEPTAAGPLPVGCIHTQLTGESAKPAKPDSCQPYDSRAELDALRRRVVKLEARVMQDSAPKPGMSVEDMIGVLHRALGAASSGGAIKHEYGCSVRGHIDLRAMADYVLKAVK